MGEWQDLRLVVRRMLTERRFAVLAVATLAIGIGASSAVFSVVETLLMRPLPFRDPDRIVHIVRIPGKLNTDSGEREHGFRRT